MFRDPVLNTPLVGDFTDVNARLHVQRADSALLRNVDYKLPHLKVW